jgi:hypothetical protein
MFRYPGQSRDPHGEFGPGKTAPDKEPSEAGENEGSITSMDKRVITIPVQYRDFQLRGRRLIPRSVARR